jgi:lysozyme family protein
MAEFLPAFERMITNEGGYRMHTVAGDRGGMTYAGIARKRWPDWTGWRAIDDGEQPEAEMVRRFYRVYFWTQVQGSDISSQEVAQTLFDFAVNAGVKTAVILAQSVAGTTPDGVMGPKTLGAINAADPDKFRLAYGMAKMARYAQIVTRDPSQRKFLLGWLNRTLKEAA